MMLEIEDRRGFSGGWLAWYPGWEWEHPLGTRHDPTARRLAAAQSQGFGEPRRPQ
jgi:hypothetical protein